MVYLTKVTHFIWSKKNGFLNIFTSANRGVFLSMDSRISINFQSKKIFELTAGFHEKKSIFHEWKWPFFQWSLLSKGVQVILNYWLWVKKSISRLFRTWIDNELFKIQVLFHLWIFSCYIDIKNVTIWSKIEMKSYKMMKRK